MSSFDTIFLLENPIVWICVGSFFLLGLLSSIAWFWQVTLSRLGLRKHKDDPTALIREEVAIQTGLERKTSFRYPDPLAVWGYHRNRLVGIYTAYKRFGKKIIMYEIEVNNPNQIKILFRSGLITSAFAKSSSRDDSQIEDEEFAFFDHFKISGKSARLAPLFVENEHIRNGLIQLTKRTGGIKLSICRNRIVCHETGFRSMSRVADEVTIACLIFEILTEMASLVDSFLPETI
ncbi:hypothetical protein [Candidatus Leptofilum sp.]|uniref:hypothetical protein n=1 Tax=Candidatus Leptofilum sp. TaxID=3241576 RepID=UPI003B5B5B6F